MSFTPTPAAALKYFMERVHEKYPDAAADFDDEKIAASIKAATLAEANAPADARFPNVSQSQFCWTKYNEWILCMKKSGDNEPECNKFKRHFNTICPAEWVESFEEHQDNDVFMGITK